MKYALLTLLFLLCACAPIAAHARSDAAPLASPQASATLAATPQNTPEPTADVVATQMALIHALETSQAEVNALQQQAKQADVDIANANAKQAQSGAETEKYKASQADSLARQKEADARNAQAVADKQKADNDAAQIQLAAKQAEAERNRALTTQIIIVAFVAVLAIATIAVLRLVTLRTLEAASARAPQPASNFHPAASSAPNTLYRRIIPAGVTEADLIYFAQNVRTARNPSGIPFSRACWVDTSIMKRAEWDALLAFLTDPKYNYAMAKNPAITNSAVTFTPDGEGYLARFANETPTPPAMENPKNGELSSASLPGQANNPVGE